MHEEVGTGEPIYLEFADALQLYAPIIGGTPAQAADQLRDQGALEGALGRPRSYVDYEDADIALQAAAARSAWTSRASSSSAPGCASGCRSARCSA